MTRLEEQDATRRDKDKVEALRRLAQTAESFTGLIGRAVETMAGTRTTTDRELLEQIAGDLGKLNRRVEGMDQRLGGVDQRLGRVETTVDAMSNGLQAVAAAMREAGWPVPEAEVDEATG